MAIATAAMVGMQVIGSIKASKGQEQQAESELKIAEGERQIAEGNQADALAEEQANLAQATIFEQQQQQRREAGLAEIGDFDRDTAALESTQSALFGAAGVQGGTGTGRLVAEATAAESALARSRLEHAAEVDALRIGQSAEFQKFAAANSGRRAAAFGEEAVSATSRGQKRFKAGKSAARSTLLTGIGSAALTGLSNVNFGGSSPITPSNTSTSFARTERRFGRT